MPNVLITGGAKRIGAAFAQRFAEAGFNVAIHYNASQDEAVALRDALNAGGRQCWLFQADLRKRAEVEQMFAAVRETMGPVTCVSTMPRCS